MSSYRLNRFAKRTQREVVEAREAAFAQVIGRTASCDACGAQFTLAIDAYRGVAMRDRVEVEAIRFACPHCGAEQAIPV
jgi:transcription elongation factor Elf1